MSDIELVIRIPEEDYERIKNSDDMNFNVIKNGTPLPKGHGRLIDAKEAYKKFYCRCLAGVAREVLDELPTIIEADKGE